MIKLAPSVLACDFSCMAEEVGRVEDAGVEYLHLDVMDGAFVPNFSFGNPVIKALRPHSRLVFDTHLMINDPKRYVQTFRDAGADILTIHYEACADDREVREVLEMIRDFGMRAGISVKPKTSVVRIAPFADILDMILVMSVEPGFGGQAFMPESLPKIAQARMIADAAEHTIEVEVDGGITPKNAAQVIAAGADVLVAGSAIFRQKDTKEAVKQLRACEKTIF